MLRDDEGLVIELLKSGTTRPSDDSPVPELIGTNDGAPEFNRRLFQARSIAALAEVAAREQQRNVNEVVSFRRSVVA